jgi:hypothetical protein
METLTLCNKGRFTITGETRIKKGQSCRTPSVRLLTIAYDRLSVGGKPPTPPSGPRRSSTAAAGGYNPGMPIDPHSSSPRWRWQDGSLDPDRHADSSWLPSEAKAVFKQARAAAGCAAAKAQNAGALTARGALNRALRKDR